MGPGSAGWLGVVEEQRPPLNASLTGTELRRWYWLRSELATFARSLGVSAGGSKVELTVRIAAVLDGEQPPPRLQRPSAAPPLLLPLTGSTVLPSGQRSTQELRRLVRRAHRRRLSFRCRDALLRCRGRTHLGRGSDPLASDPLGGAVADRCSVRAQPLLPRLASRSPRWVAPRHVDRVEHTPLAAPNALAVARPSCE